MCKQLQLIDYQFYFPVVKYFDKAIDDVDKLRVTTRVRTLSYINVKKLEISIVISNETTGSQVLRPSTLINNIDFEPDKKVL